MEWAVGITVVPERCCTELPQVVESLRAAGFPDPWLFLDGAESTLGVAYLGLQCTLRNPRIRAFGNWWLGMWEMYIRQPNAWAYMMVQDDALMVANFRQYVETIGLPEQGYANCTLYPQNFHQGAPSGKWFPATQRGLGAQCLVFSKESLLALIGTCNENVLHKPGHPNGHRNIDGAVVDTMNSQGLHEYVHYPSLVGHIGQESAIGNRRQPTTVGFPGSQFDAMSLLEGR